MLAFGEWQILGAGFGAGILHTRFEKTRSVIFISLWLSAMLGMWVLDGSVSEKTVLVVEAIMDRCNTCGAVLEYDLCSECAGSGVMWIDDGDRETAIVRCGLCDGRGGYLVCPHPEDHPKV